MPRSEVVDGYLARLGLARSAPTVEFLDQITSAHVGTFAFSSVGPRLRDDLPLDLDCVYDRIVVRARGGYCFEQNALAFEVLDELGYRVRLYLARVMASGNPDPGLTHRVSVVDIDGVSYLVDVGFGPMGPRHPVAMVSSEGTHRVVESGPGEFHVQSAKNGEAVTLYRFELARYGAADCEQGHFYSHRHPEASFVNNLVASRILPDEVRSLRNREYWVVRDGEVQALQVDAAEDLHHILTVDMGLGVTREESQQLFDELPARD